MANRSSQQISESDTQALPQFRAPIGFDLDHIDSITGTFRRFPSERECEMERVLSKFIKPHVRQVEWHSRPCCTERFVDNVKEAIAQYESTCEAKVSFDRATARRVLLRMAASMEELIMTIGEVLQWRELEKYLEDVFMKHWNVGEPVETLVGDHIPAAKRITRRLQIESGRKHVFRSFSPQATRSQLMRLVSVVSLAAEKVKLKPGDFQMDWVSHDFANHMVLAWCSATGELPTAAKSNKFMVNQSPFICLLATVNKLIVPKHRHPTAFRDYGIKAVALERRQAAEIT